MIDNLLTGNANFRRTVFKENLERYLREAKGQKPTVLWFGCSDSRLQTGHITQVMPGEIFIQRNIGNIIPPNDIGIATVLEYALNHLEIRDIVVCGHEDCGAIRALDKDLSGDAYIPLWLNCAREAKTRVDSRIQKPATPDEEEARLRLIEHENVRLQIEHLMTYPIVRQATDENRVQVHGLYYMLTTGELSRV